MRSFYDRALALVLLLGLLFAAAVSAQAGPYEDALPGFTEGTLSDTGEAIDKVAASGNPAAAGLLEALQDARLMFSAEQKKVYHQDQGRQAFRRRHRHSRSPAMRRPTSTPSSSTTGCATRSAPRSAGSR